MKKTLKTEMTKRKILDAAVEEFGTYGYDGATVNQICQKHGISKGLIYHNFENKDDLYLACVEEAVNGFISFMQGKSFASDFKYYMQERYSFFEKNPCYSRLIFDFLLTDDKTFAEKIRQVKDKYDNFNRDIYLSAIDTLKLRKGVTRGDALDYYTLLQNMLNSYLSTGKAGAENIIENHEKNLETILDFMLYGIARED